VWLTSLWTDIDIGKAKHNRNLNKVYERVCKSTPRPSIVVNSGHGLHVYYCLKTPVRVDPVKAKGLLRAIAEKLGGDLQAAEPSRLLRFPNTLNWKDLKNPMACKVRLFRPTTRRYSFAKVTDYFQNSQEENAPKNSRPEQYLDFFSQYVAELRMCSRDQAMGLCPFHDDHHPSWSLRVTDGVWHCFGCGRSGNAVSFCLLLDRDPSECPEAEPSHEHNAVAIEGGGYVAWKRERNTWRRLHISNFTIEWEIETRVSDKIHYDDRVYKGILVTEKNERIPIEMSNMQFCNEGLFFEALMLEAGSKIWLKNHYAGQVRQASLLFSTARFLNTLMDFGFQDDKTFLTPTLEITAKRIATAAEKLVDLARVEHARHLDLKTIDKSGLRRLLEHVRDDLLELHPHRVTFTLLGFLGAAPLMHFMADKTRYALWLVGPSGSGKSFVTKLFQSFFGEFVTEGRAVSWSSTTNGLQYLGYFFKDCIFLVDDYKPGITASEKGVVQFLQSYADFYARSRLTSEIKSRKDYYVRGCLLTTGEDMPSGHSSTVARSLVLSVDSREPDIAKGDRCLQFSKNYPAITARYIRFLLRSKRFGQRVQNYYHRYHTFFLKGIAREENSVRIARNLALNWTGFYWFTRFLKAIKAPLEIEAMREEQKANLLTLRDEMLERIRQEQPDEVLLQTLTEALANGACQLCREGREEASRGRPCVGFQKEAKHPYVYLYPGEVMSFVRDQQISRGHQFDWSTHAVSRALRNRGALVPDKGAKDLGARVRTVGGKLVRVWRMRKEYLGLEPPKDRL
jgi:hypothetical protein